MAKTTGKGAAVSTGTVEAELREDAPEAFKAQPARPGLPRVLLIGDSISIGYTAPVQKLLRDKAVVSRAPGNCQDSGYGLQHLKQWLGTGTWDVIHFNFGIWDTHYLDSQTGKLIPSGHEMTLPAEARRIRHPLEEYRTNLVKIVRLLKSTGAQLVWAQSTPIMFRTGARFDDISRYNAVAADVMQENGIPIDDLYDQAFPQIRAWQSSDQCHFTVKGYDLLGQRVAASILTALGQRSGATYNHRADCGCKPGLCPGAPATQGRPAQHSASTDDVTYRRSGDGATNAGGAGRVGGASR